jgi:hypothetical protein
MPERMDKIINHEEDPDQYYKPYPDPNKKKEASVAGIWGRNTDSRMRTESGSQVSKL